jgi:V8-like Glu-specific endopeptidase
MQRIATATFLKIKKAILTCCDSILEYRELVQIFNDQRIHPWKNKIPRATIPLIQVEMLIGILSEEYRSDTGENALVLFLIVLAERNDTNTECHNSLIQLASEIDRQINQPHELFPESLSKEFIRIRLESLKNKNCANYLDNLFLTDALSASRSVCRLDWHKRGVGTGCLVADDLILTSYHVICTNTCSNIATRLEQCEIRFGAIRMEDGSVSAGNLVIKLATKNPLVVFSDTNDIDFALLKLSEPIINNHSVELAKLSVEPISNGQAANIVHYPLGGPQQFSLRNNEIIAVDKNRFYYLSDTDEGSSGSPIFNDDWNVIGIHRAGYLLDKNTGEEVIEGNQGIPIQSIIEKIRKYLTITEVK